MSIRENQPDGRLPDLKPDQKSEREMIVELQATAGLPPEIRTEAQLWDEILKKQVFEMPFLLWNLIREAHGKEYPAGTQISPYGSEYSVERAETKKLTSIRTDVTMRVASSDIFHFECEIGKSNVITKRMFEYDVQVALSESEQGSEREGGEKKRKRKKKQEMGIGMEQRTLTMPYSAVLLLAPDIKAADYLKCRVRFPKADLEEMETAREAETCERAVESADKSGNSLLVMREKIEKQRQRCGDKQGEKNQRKTEDSYVNYIVSAIKVQDYTIQEISEKRLWILIPFTPIRFRPKLKQRSFNGEFAKTELTKYYKDVNMALEEAVMDGFLSERNRADILILLRKAMIRVFTPNAPLLREVIYMTEPILKFDREIYGEQWKEEIREELRPELREELRPELREELRPELREELRPELQEEMRREMDALRKAIEDRDATIAQKDVLLAEKDSVIAEKDAALKQYLLV